MTAPLRQPVDAFVDTIRPVTAQSTVMTCESFGSLPLNISPAWYIPAQIVDDSTGVHETVWIIRANGTTTATVMRGMEGTTARDWDQPVTIRCSPAIRDATMVWPTPGSVPGNLHVGARYAVAPPNGEQLVREQTARQGALPTVRAAPLDMPRSLAGAASHDKAAAMRVKAIAFGPLVTNIYGMCTILWDGVGSSSSSDLLVSTEGPRFNFVAAVLASGYLLGSGGTFKGAVTVNRVAGPPWLAQLLFMHPNGAALPNHQVAGSLLVIGG